VTLFFVVSGFLITRQVLLQQGALAHIDLRHFYLARASRILPLLGLALLVIVLLGWGLGLPFFGNDAGAPPMTPQRWLIALASVLGFWHNQLMQQPGWGYFHYVLNVYWSLSVEEAFYLLLPLLCRGLRREALIALAAGLLMLLGPAYRASHAGDEIDYLYAYPACFDALAAGVLCALASRRWTAPVQTAALWRWLAVSGLCVVWSVPVGAAPAWAFSALAACTAMWLWAAQGSLQLTTRWSRWSNSICWPVRWLGRHSYELYLFHILVLAGLRQGWTRSTLLPEQRLPLLACYLLLSAALAWALARYVGQPAMRALRQRFGQRVSTSAAV
jgi:peptidoglycan/LPS O-acetylase OafA/YrhL